METLEHKDYKGDQGCCDIIIFYIAAVLLSYEAPASVSTTLQLYSHVVSLYEGQERDDKFKTPTWHNRGSEEPMARGEVP